MADQQQNKLKKNSQPPPPTTKTTTKTVLSLTEPSDITHAEYHDLLHQIQSDFSLEECQHELLDAARYDDIDVVRALLLVYCHGSDDDDDDNRIKSTAAAAASSSSSSFTDYQDATTGNTALHMAAANGHVRIVQLLLQAGAHIAVANQAGNTPLHWAAANGQQDVVELLLAQSSSSIAASSASSSNQKVDVLQRNAFGRSALTEGFSSENTAVVKALLEHESATEERLMQAAPPASTSAADADAADATQQSVTHALLFGRNTEHPTKVRIRELAMATCQNDAILGQDNPHEDTTGLGIWAASLVCAQWMHRLVQSSLSSSSLQEQQQQLFSLSNNNQEEQVTILELGSGCGVPGLVVAAAVSAAATAATTTTINNNNNNNATTTKIYLTDFNPRTVENLQHNIALNHMNENDDTTTTKGPVQVQAQNINWQDATTWPKEKVDVMIGSDLIYQSDMVPALVDVIQGLLATDGVFFYVAPETGRKGQDDFFAKMQQQHDFVLVSERTAPAEYLENPLQSQDEEECFLHFHELLMKTTAADYKLYEFRCKSAATV